MSNRTTRALDKRLATTVADLRTTADQLKTTDQAFGPDALIIQRTGRTSGWDVSVSVAAYAIVSYRCTFTSTTLQNPYVEFVPNISLTGTTTGFEVINVWPDAANTTLQGRAWIVTLSNDANAVTFNILAAFKCTDSGTVTVASA